MSGGPCVKIRFVRPTDPAFPVLHPRPADGWVNDPNGPFRWRGRYHLFFQHNPAGPVHGGICWGHLSSSDLVTWQQEPLALVPSAGGPDAGGCWSGCVADDGGTPTAVYTGLVDDPRTATVLLARADDQLRSWVKASGPVASAPAGLAGFRDPFLFEAGGHRYAVVGAGTAGGTAEVLVYRCDDLLRWELAGTLISAGDEVAQDVAPAEIWECPQLFRLGEVLDGHWVLVVSLVRGDTLARVAYLVGDLELDRGAPRLRPTGGGLVDHGHDFYAPAVLVEEDRVVLWGWTWEDRGAGDVRAAGWAGALTWPRVLELGAGDRLTSRPAPELLALRRSSEELTGAALLAPVRLPPGPVEVVVTADGWTRLIVAGGQTELTLELDPEHRRVVLRRPTPDPVRAGWPTEGTVAGKGPVEVRLVLDGSILEVYVGGGPVFTERVYPGEGGWTLTVQGRPRATVHRLGPSTGL